MNTTYKPIDPEFLHMLAGAKARGLSWTRLAELSKIPVGELEVIPWREPQEWAKASKYAEKLVAHEVLAEMVSSLRFQMNDPVNNGRLKTQVANSLVRVIQQQHALRTPKKPPIKHAPPRPASVPSIDKEPESTPLAPPATPTPAMPTREPKTIGMATVAAVVLLFLVGALTTGCATTVDAADSPTVIAACNHTATTVTTASESHVLERDRHQTFRPQRPRSAGEIIANRHDFAVESPIIAGYPPRVRSLPPWLLPHSSVDQRSGFLLDDWDTVSNTRWITEDHT